MKRFIMILASVLLIASSAFSGDGNVDGIGNIDLKDVIISLQISAGLTPSATVNLSADVNSNGKIGLEEAIYGLQVVAQLRESAAANWYKDADGDKYSDGTKIISATRPSGGYYRESELLAASGDPNDNDPQNFSCGRSNRNNPHSDKHTDKHTDKQRRMGCRNKSGFRFAE